MAKFKQELKDKIEQLTADKQAKANYLFAESVRNFLTDKRSIDALDLVKKYHAGHSITIKELMAATTAAYVAAVAAYVHAPDSTYAANANAVYVAANAVRAAYYARNADPTITIESQIKIVDELLEDAIINGHATKVC
tara:strand:- start:6825 stop:7238 length:414 start_codon:yes stop_codon:yes gene_type:complete